MSVVDQSTESLKTIVDNAQQLRWARLSALVLVTWDYIICLDKEIELVWKRRWTRFTTLYATIRYGAGASIAFYVLSYIYPKPSNMFCIVWSMYEGYSGSFGTATFQFILAARVWGLYRKSKRMLYILAVAWSASLAGMLTVWTLHTSFALTNTAKVGNIDFYVCHETRAAPHIWLFWLSPIAYDTLICFLAIYRGYRTYRANLGSALSLVLVIVRDSVVYFIAISIAELTVLFMWLTSGGTGVIMHAPTIFAGVIPLVMCCRLMLNLRESITKLPTTMTTQGAEFPEWGYYFHEPPLEREMDSMGLRRFSGATIDDSAE